MINKTNKEGYKSRIVAKVYLSHSEILKLLPHFTSDYIKDNNKEFNDLLYNLGIQIDKPIEVQRLKHRNRLNEVVTCKRWIGDERLDSEWINSGYASVEAVDKSKNNHIIDDLYRMKGLTQDIQDSMEKRDMYSIVDESVWE